MRVSGCFKTMKKSVVNNNEAALIMGCSKSHICNLAVKYGWHFRHHGSQKMWLLSDVCKAAKVKQKTALDMLEAARLEAGKTREIKIQWP